MQTGFPDVRNAEHSKPPDAGPRNPSVNARVPSPEPDFAHTAVLTLALLPAAFVMIAFGGRPALFILCFGSVLSYIFDILGAVEVFQLFFPQLFL
jgi:hypothetical protein